MIRPQRTVHFVVLLAFALQAFVPAGFMPAAISSGHYLKLCPTGLSADVMMILHPQHSISHAEHQHHDIHQGDTGAQHEQWRADCPYGSIGNGDVDSTYSKASASIVRANSLQQKVSASDQVFDTAHSAHRPRAPPIASVA